MPRSFWFATSCLLLATMAGSIWLFEHAFGHHVLSVIEMRSLVGGITACTEKGGIIYGYQCPAPPSFSCTNLCNPCDKHSGTGKSAECEADICWKCDEGDGGGQIVECLASSNETHFCFVFGRPGQRCGKKMQINCKFDSATDKCKCPTTLNLTNDNCPRNDCI